MRTAPYYLAISQMSDEAAEALARAVGERDRDIPGLIGPQPVVEILYRRLLGAGVPAVRTIEYIRALESLADRPAGVPGAAVPATAADLDLLVAWIVDFQQEVGMAVSEDPQGLRASLPAELDRIRLWRVAGRPVALASHAPLVRLPGLSTARVTTVYTPRTHRRRGYATALTHAIAKELLAQVQLVLLFADADDPTANGVYERLGFQRRAEVVEVAFD
jgi:predicted GNAT family acetyltransferase